MTLEPEQSDGYNHMTQELVSNVILLTDVYGESLNTKFVLCSFTFRGIN